MSTYGEVMDLFIVIHYSRHLTPTVSAIMVDAGDKKRGTCSAIETCPPGTCSLEEKSTFK